VYYLIATKVQYLTGATT